MPVTRNVIETAGESRATRVIWCGRVACHPSRGCTRARLGGGALVPDETHEEGGAGLGGKGRKKKKIGEQEREKNDNEMGRESRSMLRADLDLSKGCPRPEGKKKTKKRPPESTPPPFLPSPSCAQCVPPPGSRKKGRRTHAPDIPKKKKKKKKKTRHKKG